MTAPELRLTLADEAELAREFQDNLRHGRAFLGQTCAIEVLSDCVLVLAHPDGRSELRLPAQAVMVTPNGSGCSVGVELRPFDDDVRSRIERFVSGIEKPAPCGGTGDDPEVEADAMTAAREPSDDEESIAPSDADAGATEVASDESSRASSDRQRQAPRHEQLRHLTTTEQHKLARSGDLTDRNVLERLYGKNVWEPLLHNPKLTVPEVARIARKGTVPRPLLEFILENNAWIQTSVVRRALLGNPRLTAEGVQKLVRITPKHELRTIVKTTTYPSLVRDVARKFLG